MNTHIQTQKPRFYWIDWLKGLAILSILIFHFFQNYPERITLISVLDRNLAKLGYAAVDIFFVIAGFTTSYTLASKFKNNPMEEIKINWQLWLSKRLMRIYPAYLLAVITSCSLYYLFSRFHIKSPVNFVLSCLGLAGIKLQEINPGFWFFTVILQAYLFTPLIFWFCQNQQNKILTLGIVGGILTKIIAFYFLISDDKSTYIIILQNNFLGSYLSQLCIGIYWGFIYAEHQKFRKKDFIVATSIFSLGLCLYIILGITKTNIIYMLGFDMLFTPFFFLGMQSLLKHLEKIANLDWLLGFLSILGIYSYQIYLIHQPLYFVLLPTINRSIQINHYLQILVSFIIIIPSLTSYVFLFCKIEKIMIKNLGCVMNKQN